MIGEMLLMFLILLDFLKLEFYYSIPILICMLLIMPVKLKDFTHATRSHRNNIQNISCKAAKFFMEPTFIINELITKKKLLTKRWSTFTGISLLPLIDTNNSSVNYSPQGNERLLSFFPGWPHSELLPPSLLASAGYHYTGVKDFIKCGGCGTKRQPSIEGIENFKRNLKCEICHDKSPFTGGSQRTYDSAYDRLFSFFSGSTQFSLLSPLTLANAGYYYTGFNNTIACSHCGTKRQLRIEEIDEFKKDLTCRKCIEDQHTEANLFEKYPTYRSVLKRLATFKNWKHHEILSPTVLAKAGFFYFGYSDCVRCFHCGLDLENWKPGDDIYTEHKRFRPTCQFLQSLLLQRNLYSLDTQENTAEENISGQNITKNVQENQNEAPIQDLFLPCGEMYTCKDCSNKFTHCPSCRKRIQGTVTVYFT